MSLTRHHPAAALLASALLLTAGCADVLGPTGPTEPTTAPIEITISTVSDALDIDPDGYALSFDGRPEQAVGVNASVTIDAVRDGYHSVRLVGLSANCSVQGPNPRTVAVSGDRAASRVVFTVWCFGANSGAGDWDY